MEFLQHIEKSGMAVREKAVKKPDTNVWFRASTPAVDRYGEIVISTGIKMESYLKNPVFGWGHGVYGGIKDNFIGKVVDYEVSSEALDIEVEFIPDAGKNPDGSGYGYLDMVKGGFLNAVSIGFKGIMEHVEELKGLGPVRIWDETELLEVSLVGIPANPEAVRKSLDLGFEQTLVTDFTNTPAPSQDADTAELIRKAFMAHKIRNGMKL